jgi:hypothetical protein
MWTVIATQNDPYSSHHSKFCVVRNLHNNGVSNTPIVLDLRNSRSVRQTSENLGAQPKRICLSDPER